MFVLALSDPAQITVDAFQLVFSAVVSVVLWKLAVAQRKSDGMEAKLSELAGKLVEERFRGMSHQVDGSVNAFSLTLQSLTERLRESENGIDGLSERDQKMELSVNTKLDQLKDWIRENMAGKHDMEKHEGRVDQKFDVVHRDVAQLAKEVAVLGQKVQDRA